MVDKNIEFKNILIKLFEKTIINDNNCWIYKGVSRYSNAYIEGKTYSLHRLSAYIFLGLNLNSKLQANHKPICKYKRCWNPFHIYIGNQLQNVRDTINQGLHGKRDNLCHKGHELTEENTYHYRGRRSCRICRTKTKTEYALKYKNRNKSG